MSTNDSHSQRLARVRLLAIVKSQLEIDRAASATSDFDSVVFEPSEFGAMHEWVEDIYKAVRAAKYDA